MTSGKFWEWCRTIRLGPPPSPPSSDFAFQPIDPFSVPKALWLRPTVLALPAKSTQEIRPLDRASILARPVLCHWPWGYPIRLLSKEEATALEPRLDFGPISATTLTEIEGHVDTQRLIPACVAGVVARGGVTDWNSPVTGFRLAERDGIGQVTAVLCADRTIACDYVVITGGPDTTALAEMAGVHVPVLTLLAAQS